MSKKIINPTQKIENNFKVIRVAIAISIALILTFLIVNYVSVDPMETMKAFMFGPFSSLSRFGYILEKMTPLLFTGVGVSIMYAGSQFNMAAEGAFFLGGVGASYIAIKLGLPYGIHPVVVVMFGTIVGALVTAIPALMYIKLKALPVVTSLMVNYIAQFLGLFIINYVIFDPSAGYMASQLFKETALLPKILPGTNVHLGLIIAIIVVVVAYLFLMKSKGGYEIRMLGKNSNFSLYSGMNVDKTILVAQLIGGGLAGMGGAIEQMGMFTRFQFQGLTGHGFDGIMIAILARYNPKFVPVAAFFLAYVRVGADIMQRTSDVPVEIVSIIQAIIIIFIAAERFLDTWKRKAIVRASEAQAS